jgi:hypothetical protein
MPEFVLIFDLDSDAKPDHPGVDDGQRSATARMDHSVPRIFVSDYSAWRLDRPRHLS